MTAVVVKQWIVAGSTLLAALPVGCSVGYPSVLLHQLKANDSSLQLDWETSSWIGSIHGIAGIPSILMPVFMQWRGRKLAFIVACLVNILGWIVAFTATTSTSILISESIHGFSSESILAVGLLSMSEMVSPQIRTVSMSLYLVMQSLGMALVGIVGSYLHWRTLTLVICAPLVVVVILAACVWPESPAWLAYKGEFDKCERAFTSLRGTGSLAQMELEELILAQKENMARTVKCANRSLLLRFWQTLKSRDFYLPAIHMYVLLHSIHWTGVLVTIIYSSEIVERVTHGKDSVPFGVMMLNIMMFSGCIASIVLIRFFQTKRILVTTLPIAAVCLLSASVVNYSQSLDLLPNESFVCLYLLVIFVFVICLGLPVVVTITAELMPVKNRGVGGPYYVILTCLLHTTTLKLAPYLFRYLNLWGTFLIYSLSGIISTVLIWNFVPETKGKTLQELEDFYAYGNIDKRRRAPSRLNAEAFTEGRKLILYNSSLSPPEIQ